MDEVLPEENDLLDPGTLVSDSQYKLGSREELRDSLHESIDSLDQPLLEQQNGGGMLVLVMNHQKFVMCKLSLIWLRIQ